jgi:tetratricopeptide (TPR) repeat protein
VKEVAIKAEIAGSLAQTRVEIVLANPNARIYEGELQFPLLDGQTVSGFALDIDGKLRDAVPVEKARAQEVFEDIRRQGADPGLLETTAGNQYKLRIYPLPAQGERRVAITLTESLAWRGDEAVYRVPLGFSSRIGQLSFKLSAAVEGNAVHVVRGPEGMVARADGQGTYIDFTQRDFEPHGLAEISVRGARRPVVLTQARDEGTYFYAELPLKEEPLPRPKPRHILLVWDASGSAAAYDHNRVYSLLDSYFRYLGNVDVEVSLLRERMEQPVSFPVQGGDWASLRTFLDGTPFDGATCLDNILVPESVQAVLLVSDGLTTFGRIRFGYQGSVPLFAINAAVAADTDRLRHAAEGSGGALVDLTRISPADALPILTHAGWRLVRLSSTGARHLVPGGHRAVEGRLVFAGILTEPHAEIEVEFEQPSGTHRVEQVYVEPHANGSFAAQGWARLKVRELLAERAINRAEIRRLGKRFRLVTPETSLMVLERVEDYVRYEIDPPAELREAFEKLRAQRTTSDAADRQGHLENVVHQFDDKIAWWDKDFPKEKPPMPAQSKAAPPLPDGFPEEVQGSSSGEELRGRIAQQVSESVSVAAITGKSVTAQSMAPDIKPISIQLRQWEPDAPYHKRLSQTSNTDLYRIYLDERGSYTNSTAFFLDAADIFFARGLDDLGVRVVSNLAEMNLENRHLLRILGYRLMQAKEPLLALPVFERVVEIAPNEPQSYRDLGLAYDEAGLAQQAVDTLWEVVSRPWHGRFPGIELIALTELNAIVARAEATGHPMDLSRVDPRLRRNLPLDLRAVLSWDADDTDIDLWVTDPNSEKAYYGNKLTYQGGRNSDDFTGGYGPEEFSLKHAKPGKYLVEAQFFGHRQQVVAGATTLMLRLTTGFGMPAQKDEWVSLRLSSGKEIVRVGEFEVGALRSSEQAMNIQEIPNQIIVTAGLTQASVCGIFREHIEGTERCVTQFLQRQPDAKGIAILSLLINATGQVAYGTAFLTGLDDDGLKTCLAKEATAWSFPLPSGGKSVSVTYPFQVQQRR